LLIRQRFNHSLMAVFFGVRYEIERELNGLWDDLRSVLSVRFTDWADRAPTLNEDPFLPTALSGFDQPAERA